MNGTFRKLVCFLLLLAIMGTVSGAGYCTAEHAGIAMPANQPVAGSVHMDKGLSGITGGAGTKTVLVAGCYFPIINLPAYYVCIMVCKIGGGGNACAPRCEASLSVCT
jgi:hypothetical protein